MPPLPRLDEAMGVGKRGFRPQARVAQEKADSSSLQLHGEAAASTLSAGACGPSQTRLAGLVDNSQQRGKVLRVYKWSQFYGKDEVTEFDEAHFACEGKFSQNSSEGHKEYQDRLRAIHLRKEGLPKAEIAKALGRSEKFVAKWWQKDTKEIPRPWGVHQYLTKDMGKNEKGVGATNGASMTDESVNDTATWWRDIEIRRKYANDASIYDDILQNTEWKPSNARTRDFATGAYHLKYDQRGNIKWEGHQGGKYKQGLSPAMDKVMQKLFAEYGIADRTSGVITNWYPDGKGNLGSHRHDCWTALFSFGHERILTIDNTPLLMQDGDLCIFGTQRHGVPVMPEISEGRITLVIFFYPDKMQKQGMWQTITDPETMAPSRPLVAMLRDRDLGSTAEQKAVDASDQLQTLLQLGFSREDGEVALRSAQFDVQKAVEFLLLASQEACAVCHQGDNLLPVAASAEVVSGPARRGRFRKNLPGKSASELLLDCSSTASSSSTAVPADAGSSSSSSGSVAMASTCNEDEMLARRLQLEEASATSGMDVDLGSAMAPGEMSESEVAALALHLEEMDQQHPDPSMLAAQFQEYEQKFNLQDAERWNGNGDLMHSPFSREHLSLEKMDKATIYSVGHGDMLEKDFWEMLQCNSIRVLYDVRQTDYRGELYSRHQRFTVASLRAQCRTRGIVYKPMPVGRESAYGTLAHIKTDEGQHTLIELVWQANRKRTAFLGKEQLWRDDSRQAVAEELTKAGHVVEHVFTDGSTERHQSGIEFPDWMVREEDRLKLVEKKRQAGEMEKPQKASADRSTEAIAARLSRPAEEVDAMQMMKGAANQKELIVAQRQLARYQRLAEAKGALASKVVKNVPEWILDDARKQAEWVAGKKKAKEEAEHSRNNGSSAKAIDEEAMGEATQAEDAASQLMGEDWEDFTHLLHSEASGECSGTGFTESTDAAVCNETIFSDVGVTESTDARPESNGPVTAVDATNQRRGWRGRRKA